MSSPYERTKAELVKMGYEVGRTEHFNTFVKIRQDLFNCIDLIGLKKGSPLLLIQCTTGDNASKRIEKMRDKAAIIASTGSTVEMWAWRKVGDRGKRKLWAVRRERFDLAGVTHNLDEGEVLKEG